MSIILMKALEFFKKGPCGKLIEEILVRIIVDGVVGDFSKSYRDGSIRPIFGGGMVGDLESVPSST